MTDDQHGEGTPQGGGRWDPLPQGDYDDGATAFVQLPEGGIDALLAASESPLAAPGHGYVPPPITVTPATTAGSDPAATGAWSMPAEGAQWPDPEAVPQQDAAHDRFTYDPGATGQWTYAEPPETYEEQPEALPAPGHDVTGQWSIPVAGGDLPDESGEFTTSALVEQWGGTPPATLPGGAPAPWATEGAGQAWAQQATAGDGGRHPQDHPQSHSEAHAEPTPAHGMYVGHLPEAEAEAESAEAPAPEAGEAGEAGGAPETPGASDTAGAGEAVEAVSGAVETPEGTEPTGMAPDAPTGGESAAEGPAEAEAEVLPDAEPAQAAGTPPPPSDAAPEQEHAPEPAAAPDAAEDPPALPGEEHPLASYVLRVNGGDRPVTDAWIGESLLYVLRERLGLAGAKDGCSQGECGACNVQVDGRLVASCLVPAVTAAGSEVRTVEGLAVDGQPSDVQRALARCGAVQCGFCVPGMAMTVHDLLEGNPAPTELETRQALCGNLCRCSGYRAVVDAVQEVVAERDAHAASDAAETDEARIPHQAGPGAGGVNPSAFEAFQPHDPSFGQGPGDGQGQGQGQDGGQV
ncbi:MULTISPECIES: 2Fe-2S iron-sulfur cluster-binding protein [unclassified Streptomyces]|uniref:2Fe-2S iron-sulfur cluster-binding protein n=1 Tax=unclassified Streptomyces TaxID=2593676 RepID=UPI00093E3512|nr:2Fe-2S iron-sulfur cluster-binding protein [Streptomyces sp. TSRI0107]OKJ90264.1 (2Fe-2S)-binding protein [Streptomyces sp. TSRI0107]